ncbi:E3 ubiquitin-protein ligase APD2-like [Hibiscus syriacus]|uniref:E3 ubiquitin-protein ligase APD2-like n=1 Tax=Hibiscus syriacus TaxID=106335 RepID=UPI0019234F77|nr:E3 ubiquitin-protein ligase APD2-like [Hibiscus syriacus]
MVYGFHRPPPLDVVISWSETHDIIIPAKFHKEWLFLYKGSRVNISYTIRSAGSLPLSLAVAQGIESLGEWVEDPSYPNTSLSWNIIYGNDEIQQEVPKASNYYVAVGNFNSKEVQIQLKFSVKALVYDTSRAYYRCSFGDHMCALELYFLEDIVAVLSSPARNEETLNSIW